MTETRKIFVHYHLFKNAGTSIDSMLKKSFGDRWENYDLPAAGAKISPNQLQERIESKPDLLAISSHQIVPPLIKGDIDVFPLLFIRHPIDRVKSAYLFEWQKQLGLDTPKGTLAEYVTEKLSSYRQNAIEEFHVLRFANRGYASHTPSKDLTDDQRLENAKAFINGLPCFGIVEEFNRSIDLFEKTVPEGFPKLTFERSVRANSLQDPTASLQEKLEKVKEELGKDLYTELIMRNQLDIQFYNYVLGMFHSLLKK